MCGIAGIYRRHGAPVPEDLLRAMTARLAHRGPDGDGFHVEPGLGFGHRRLSIIDVAGGAQPMSNEDGTIWVTFNGEIYDFEEKQRWLESRGHRLCTRSDTEVIVHLYEELGEQVIEALNGMFALAIWDGPARRLLLARDRLGQKPLYYHWDGERLVFASELKGVMAAPWVPRERSESALDAYLTFGYVPSPSTIYRGVGKLRPGHIMVFDEANVRTRRYWDLAFRNDGAPLSIDDAVDRCDEMVGEATRCRLVSEVPLGVSSR